MNCECGNSAFRFLYPNGDNKEGDDLDMIVCTECGGDAPDGIKDDQIVND